MFHNVEMQSFIVTSLFQKCMCKKSIFSRREKLSHKIEKEFYANLLNLQISNLQ